MKSDMVYWNSHKLLMVIKLTDCHEGKRSAKQEFIFLNVFLRITP